MSAAIDLQALLAQWAPRLGLQDYRIHLELVKPAAFSDNNTLGDCDRSRTKRTATIRLLEPGHVGVAEDDVDDQETVLVHELLHLVMPMVLFGPPVTADDLRYQLYEQGVDRLARTLVALSHELPETPAPPPLPPPIVPPWPDVARILRLRLYKLVETWRSIAISQKAVNQRPHQSKKYPSAQIGAHEACANELEATLKSED